MEKFTLIVYSENQAGILGLITTVFTCRHININSIQAEESSVEGIHRSIIEVTAVDEKVENLSKQIEKKVFILKTYIVKSEDFHPERLTPQRERELLEVFLN